MENPVVNTDASYLGISMAGNDLVLAQIGSTGDATEVNQLACLRMEESFDFDAVEREGVEEAFAQTIDAALRMKNIEARRASLSLPDQMALVKTFPIDSELGAEELGSHVMWEVDQFILSEHHDYVVDYHQLPQMNREEGRLLVVAVRKPIVDLLKRTFDSTRLTLEAIDLDMFASLRAVRANHELAEKSKAALVRLEPGFMKIVLLWGGEFVDFEEFSYSGGTDVEDPEWVSKFASEVYDNANSLVDHAMPGSEIGGFDRVLVFGPSLSNSLMDAIQERCSASVDKVNPFNRVHLSSEAEQSRGTHDPLDFLCSMGAALRGI